MRAGIRSPGSPGGPQRGGRDGAGEAAAARAGGAVAAGRSRSGGLGPESGEGGRPPAQGGPLGTAVGRGGGEVREPGPRQVMKARAMGGSEAAVRAASWSRLSGEGGRQEGELPCSSAFLPRSLLSPPPPVPAPPPTPPASSLLSIPSPVSFFPPLFSVTLSPYFFPSSPPPSTRPRLLSVLHQKFEQLSILLLPFTFKCCVILN